MANDRRIYLVQFFTPSEVKKAPTSQRPAILRGYFRHCMDKLAPRLHDVEVVSQQQLLLSAGLRATSDAIDSLKTQLTEEHLGTVVLSEMDDIVATSR